MARTLDEQKNEMIEQLAERVRERLKADEVAMAEIFVKAYYRYVAPEDLVGRDIGDLYGIALAHMRFGQSRAAETPKVRVYNPRIEQHGFQSTHTVLETVNEDMPFLVDSVSNELTKRGLGIHLVFHPIFRVARDDGDVRRIEGSDSKDAALQAESFMHFEFDRQSDPDALAELERALLEVLDDVRHSVRDWPVMRGRIDTAIEEMRSAVKAIDADDVTEYVAFLEWLRDDHFTLLGYSKYDLEQSGEGLRLKRQKGSGLGILKGHDEGLPSQSFQALSSAARTRAMQPFPPVIIAKANTRSTVHRATYLDYIGVKRFDEVGKVVGENRFLGLFTSAAYNLSPRFIPVLRRKMDQVVEAARLQRTGH
ncbi:MAG: NAD-glutamate dehydrogenase, partial [Pseudomonadota bacterium]